MTTHGVCLDGTGQTRTQANPTNICLIFNAMGGAIVDAENNSFESTLLNGAVTAQVGKYLAGVGTGSIPLFDLLGQVDGEGIAEQIVRGYTFLSRPAITSRATTSSSSASAAARRPPAAWRDSFSGKACSTRPTIIRKTRRAPIFAASPPGTNIGRASPTSPNMRT
jgi:hypothetical protein